MDSWLLGYFSAKWQVTYDFPYAAVLTQFSAPLGKGLLSH